MANRTANIGLIKPEGENNFDIKHFNENADIIDREIGDLKGTCAVISAQDSTNEGKVLKIVNGMPTWVSLTNADEVSF